MVKKVGEKIKCQKIDKFYFRDHTGRTRKYLQYCRRLKCKTESSYNYENLKPKYCFKHKKDDMVNVKRNHKLCDKCKSSYKKSVFQENVNIQLKIIKLNQNI